VPNGVDVALFHPGPADPRLRASLGLDEHFVVGWSGSFRAFHGLDVLVEAAAIARKQVPQLALLLAGDGVERAALERRAAELGVPAVFPGTVGYDDMPELLRLMNLAVVPAPDDASFHYSPMKLREYQACGRTIIAASIGEMERSLRDGTDAVLVPAGDVDALSRAIVELTRDPAKATDLASRARDAVVAGGSWSRRLESLEARLCELVTS
jgi:glycosyltransferase involved in cell wall biosynthesis